MLRAGGAGRWPGAGCAGRRDGRSTAAGRQPRDHAPRCRKYIPVTALPPPTRPRPQTPRLISSGNQGRGAPRDLRAGVGPEHVFLPDSGGVACPRPRHKYERMGWPWTGLSGSLAWRPARLSLCVCVGGTLRFPGRGSLWQGLAGERGQWAPDREWVPGASLPAAPRSGLPSGKLGVSSVESAGLGGLKGCRLQQSRETLS